MNGFLSFFYLLARELKLVSFYQILTLLGKKEAEMELVYIACFGRGETELTEFLRVFRVFESFTGWPFSPNFTEFFEFKFLLLELLPLRVVTAVKLWLFYKSTVNKIDCKVNDSCCTLAQSGVRLAQQLSFPSILPPPSSISISILEA